MMVLCPCPTIVGVNNRGQSGSISSVSAPTLVAAAIYHNGRARRGHLYQHGMMSQILLVSMKVMLADAVPMVSALFQHGVPAWCSSMVAMSGVDIATTGAGAGAALTLSAVPLAATEGLAALAGTAAAGSGAASAGGAALTLA